MTERASSPFYQLFACQGKAAFETFGLADKVAKRRRRSKTFKNGHPQTPYKCVSCGQWHIGGRRTKIARVK